MRRVVLWIGVGIFLVAAALLSWQWLGVGQSSFETEGRVTGFSDDGTTVYVEHEAIDGFREATTTPFQVESPSVTDSLTVGEALRLQFRAGSVSPQITKLEELPDNAVPKNPSMSESEQSEASDSAMLDVGEEAPDISLLNQEGTQIRLSDFRGQALFLTFIYTNCPLPDFCPLMSTQFADLQPKLKDAFDDEAHLLSISFDPENDTPPVLKKYGRKHTDDFTTWTFATPTSTEQLEQAKEAFGVTTMERQGEIVHNLVTALIGPDGRLVWIWRGNDWRPEDLLEVARKTFKDGTLTEARAE